MSKFANLPEFRERVRRIAEMTAREEGLGDVVVYVEVQEAHRDKPRVVRIIVEEIDGTDPRGRRWGDN